MVSADRWGANRSCAKHRKHIEKILKKAGANTHSDFIRLTHCLSLGDTLWVKSEAENLVWRDVSLYRNRFDDTISRIAFEGYGIDDTKFSTIDRILGNKRQFSFAKSEVPLILDEIER